jgi:DNA segregation ATPase FtsK/SpoIIIE-like protein
MIEEMEKRYEILKSAGVDDLGQYNELQKASSLASTPRIVCVCDEFADLLLRDKHTRKEIEARVARLGVKGRAAGVHLVFATQRAGREILKGTIDSNLPARVALSVPREIDSRLVLGEAGAEKLLGKGDLLYKDIGVPIRLQGLLVTRDELSEIANGR